MPSYPGNNGFPQPNLIATDIYAYTSAVFNSDSDSDSDSHQHKAHEEAVTVAVTMTPLPSGVAQQDTGRQLTAASARSPLLTTPETEAVSVALTMARGRTEYFLAIVVIKKQ